MSKKKYYIYTAKDLQKLPNTVTFPILDQIKVDSNYSLFHPDHIDVLDVDFEIGQLVETYKKEIGIVIGVVEAKDPLSENESLPSNIYKVQIGSKVKEMLGISLKKIKLT